MKTVLLKAVMITGITAFLFCGCSSSKTKNEQADAHNSRKSLDWDGVYWGVLPCADCEGIQKTIYLNKDLSYRVKANYLGRQEMEYSGKFSWNAQGNAIVLQEATDQSVSYFVGENTLTQLDIHGNLINGELAGNYILSKGSYALLEKYWKLTELYGKPVTVDTSFRKEPHIIFKDGQNRFTGNGGCNDISGTYRVSGADRISVSQEISTRMACPGMALERQFLETLAAAENFTVQGDMLVLSKAGTSLARFKKVYMK